LGEWHQKPPKNKKFWLWFCSVKWFLVPEMLLAGTLAVTLGLFGIDTLHAVEDIFGIGTLDAGLAGTGIIATGAWHGVGGQLTATGVIGFENRHKKNSWDAL
jgi:hypothetical protein